MFYMFVLINIFFYLCWLSFLQSVSQLITVAVNSSFLIEKQQLQADDKEDEVIKTTVEDRVKHISTYLQKR